MFASSATVLTGSVTNEAVTPSTARHLLQNSSGTIKSPALTDKIILPRHISGFHQQTMAKMRDSGTINVLANATTRFSATLTGNKRLWAIGDSSGEASFNIIENASLVPGSINFSTMRAENGAKYMCRLDGMGSLYLGSTTDHGVELGFQFRHKATSTNTWGSWQDCKMEDITETIDGNSVTTYDVSNLYGSSTVEHVQTDNATGNARFHSIFREKRQGTSGHKDLSPPFWIGFIVGSAGLFPQTNRDYQFRFVFASSIENTGTFEKVFNYSESLIAKRIA